MWPVEGREELGIFLDSVERFATDRIDSSAIDRAGRIPPDLLKELAELGVFGLSIPEAYGGTGMTLSDVCDVVATLARFDRSVAVTCGLHLGLGTRGLVAYGSEATKQRFLPRLASGEAIAAFATTEPGAGSDLSAIRTTAVADGDRLRLRGEKIYVTNGGFADVITLTASTPNLGGARRGHSLIVLDRATPGVEIGREEKKLGLRGSSTVGIGFDDVDVEPLQVIGEPGAGMTQLAHVLAWGRTVMAAGCLGAAQTALERARSHVEERHQFGRALIEQPVVQDQLADYATLLFAARATVAWTTDAEADPAELARRSTVAKVFASEVGWEIADGAVQLFGGAGFIEETGIPLLLRDARITRIFEGANDVLLGHLGAIEATTSAAGRIPREVGGVVQTLRSAREALLREHGLRLLRRPSDLHRLGRITLLRDVDDAVAVRTRSSTSPQVERLAERWKLLLDQRLQPLLRYCSDRDRPSQIVRWMKEVGV